MMWNTEEQNVVIYHDRSLSSSFRLDGKGINWTELTWIEPNWCELLCLNQWGFIIYLRLHTYMIENTDTSSTWLPSKHTSSLTYNNTPISLPPSRPASLRHCLLCGWTGSGFQGTVENCLPRFPSPHWSYEKMFQQFHCDPEPVSDPWIHLWLVPVVTSLVLCLLLPSCDARFCMESTVWSFFHRVHLHAGLVQPPSIRGAWRSSSQVTLWLGWTE